MKESCGPGGDESRKAVFWRAPGPAPRGRGGVEPPGEAEPAIIQTPVTCPPPPPRMSRSAGGWGAGRRDRTPCWFGLTGSRPAGNLFAVCPWALEWETPDDLINTDTLNSLFSERSESDYIIKHSWKLPSW